jgi:Gpi18-like mannosyltransferase
MSGMPRPAWRIDRLCAGLLFLGLAARIAGLPFESHDATESLIPWYSSIAQGGFAVLGTDLSNYNPPYLYLLWLASLVFGSHDPLLAAKSVSIAGDVGLCTAVALLLARSGASAVSFARAFAVIWCIPTVVINSSVWGQCDALYTACVAGALAAACRPSRPLLALGLFGAALAIKLQAILAAPAIALLLLMGRIPWRAVLASVVCYVALLAPAAVAGRSWQELLTVYVRQTEVFQDLAMSAPNVWTVCKHFVPADSFGLWTAIGLLTALAAGVAYLILGTRRLSQGANTAILETAFVSAFVFPFLLPKMHDRYFFLADVLSAALALADRRWLNIALLVQIGSLTAYAPFLLGWRWPLALGVASNTLVFAALALRWYPPAQRVIPDTLLRGLGRIGPAPAALGG